MRHVLVASQRQYLLTQTAEHRSKIGALDRQLAQKEAERGTAAATIAKFEALIPLLQQQVDVRKTLFDREIGSKLLYLQNLQQLTEAQQELAVQKSKFHETEAAVAAIKETRAQAKAEYRRMLCDDLGKVEPKAAALAQDVIRTEERARLQALKAPVDGVVQQLAVHTVGGVVTPAQPLLVLVPVDSRLEIEAMVSNRDIGFVEPGQAAEVKVTTFNFTRYGLLHGNVLSVSHDAVGKDDLQDQPGTGASRTAKPPSPLPMTKARSTPPASRSTGPRCKSRTSRSTLPPAWQSRPRSRPASAASLITCSRPCANTARTASESGSNLARPIK